MMAARLGVWLVLAVAVAAAPGPAHAQDANRPVPYRVKPGDTLELIAAEFYGDRTKAVFLMEENKMTHARPLRPGERLRIPISRDVTTAPGDTFESLAMTYLGSARRGSFLADFNGASQDSLPAGSSVTIPFTITHTAQSTESLSDIAKAYFGDGKNAEMLRRYNFLERSSIDKGEQLIVPVYHVRLSAAKQPALDAESRARREHRREATARVARALPAARQAWKDGDFAAVKAALVPLEPDLDYLDSDEGMAVAVLLGAAHVAYGDSELALACFKRVIDRQDHAALRSYDYSPKILALWHQAGGAIE
ncbi:MAG: LysM peptidoglycan-binding domain-containing protein [Deltaproteobacteria bacterium]|nr:MAG: LysM peptidoglycan-binding domain-containing protein [Deltaproteobacteria bacterium]TMQ19946.1 MAG: LysM peptidoglycan-binding domain-containing protein [Deltaproteobacteria bacterium]